MTTHSLTMRRQSRLGESEVWTEVTMSISMEGDGREARVILEDYVASALGAHERGGMDADKDH